MLKRKNGSKIELYACMLKFDQILNINTPVGVDIPVGMSMVNINKIKIPCTLNTQV